MSALAQQQQMLHGGFVAPQPKATTLFIGSISGGITDTYLNNILSVSDVWDFEVIDLFRVSNRLADLSRRSSDSSHLRINLKDLALPNSRIRMAHCGRWRC